jgi:uncharacterized protein YerC
VWWATRQLRRGREPATRVPVAAVRKHLDELARSGWTQQAVAGAAGISVSTISRIRRRGTKHCSRIVAGAILAVR